MGFFQQGAHFFCNTIDYYAVNSLLQNSWLPLKIYASG
jgi:hypothetical protein